MLVMISISIDLDKCSIIEDDHIVVTEQGVHWAPFHLKKGAKSHQMRTMLKSYQGEKLALSLLAHSRPLVFN